MDQKRITGDTIPVVQPGDPISASGWNRVARAINRPYDYGDVAASENTASAVATTDTIIPGRNTTTGVPGGPTTVTIMESSEGSAFVAGDTVEIYSWVKTDSADPADEDGGLLYIYITQDLQGTWWFTAQDCTVPATSIISADLSADTVVTTTVAALPGTTLTAPTFHGVYNYNMFYQFNIAGVLGNQTWDVSIGLYNQTQAAWALIYDIAGTGDLLFDPRGSRVSPFEVDATNAGDTVVLAVSRLTTTGTVTAIALNAAGGPATGHDITGPL